MVCLKRLRKAYCCDSYRVVGSVSRNIVGRNHKIFVNSRGRLTGLDDIFLPATIPKDSANGHHYCNNQRGAILIPPVLQYL